MAIRAFPKLCENQILHMKYGDNESSHSCIVQDSFPCEMHKLQLVHRGGVCQVASQVLCASPCKTQHVCAVFFSLGEGPCLSVSSFSNKFITTDKYVN